jgi:hypothetical protein
MAEYSLVPVDYQPDFGDVSLVPVDYDPFAPSSADDMIRQANVQLAGQPQRTPTDNDPEADAAAMSPETYVNPFVKRTLGNLATLPQRAIDASTADMRHLGEDGYAPQSIGPAVETALTMMGGSGTVPAGMIPGARGVTRGVGLGETLARGPIRAAETATIGDGAPIAGQTLYHYTNEAGLNSILQEGKLNPSLKAINPSDVRYGNGQYLSDISPGAMKPSQLSRAFINLPFQGRKFTHYLEINTGDLNVIRGRPGVYVVPNEVPLNLNDRVISSGKVPGG